MSQDVLFVLPGDRLSTLELRQILEASGVPFCQPDPADGARYAALDQRARACVDAAIKPALQSIVFVNYEQSASACPTPTQWLQDPEDPTSDAPSAIQQAIDLIEPPVSDQVRRRVHLISVMERGGVELLTDCGATPQEIAAISLEWQALQEFAGYDSALDAQNVLDRETVGRLTIVRLHQIPPPTRVMTDFFGTGVDQLLVLATGTAWALFQGEERICRKLLEELGGNYFPPSGGRQSYWDCYDTVCPSHESILSLVQGLL